VIIRGGGKKRLEKEKEKEVERYEKKTEGKRNI